MSDRVLYPKVVVREGELFLHGCGEMPFNLSRFLSRQFGKVVNVSLSVNLPNAYEGEGKARKRIGVGGQRELAIQYVREHRDPTRSPHVVLKSATGLEMEQGDTGTLVVYRQMNPNDFKSLQLVRKPVNENVIIGATEGAPDDTCFFSFRLLSERADQMDGVLRWTNGEGRALSLFFKGHYVLLDAIESHRSNIEMWVSTKDSTDVIVVERKKFQARTQTQFPGSAFADGKIPAMPGLLIRRYRGPVNLAQLPDEHFRPLAVCDPKVMRGTRAFCELVIRFPDGTGSEDLATALIVPGRPLDIATGKPMKKTQKLALAKAETAKVVTADAPDAQSKVSDGNSATTTTTGAPA